MFVLQRIGLHNQGLLLSKFALWFVFAASSSKYLKCFCFIQRCVDLITFQTRSCWSFETAVSVFWKNFDTVCSLLRISVRSCGFQIPLTPLLLYASSLRKVHLLSRASPCSPLYGVPFALAPGALVKSENISTVRLYTC